MRSAAKFLRVFLLPLLLFPGIMNIAHARSDGRALTQDEIVEAARNTVKACRNLDLRAKNQCEEKVLDECKKSEISDRSCRLIYGFLNRVGVDGDLVVPTASQMDELSRTWARQCGTGSKVDISNCMQALIKRCRTEDKISPIFCNEISLRSSQLTNSAGIAEKLNNICVGADREQCLKEEYRVCLSSEKYTDSSSKCSEMFSEAVARYDPSAPLTTAQTNDPAASFGIVLGKGLHEQGIVRCETERCAGITTFKSFEKINRFENTITSPDSLIPDRSGFFNMGSENRELPDIVPERSGVKGYINGAGILVAIEFPSYRKTGLDQMTKKYGAPQLSRWEYQNGYGAKWIGSTYTWKTNSITLKLDCSKLESSGNTPDSVCMAVAQRAQKTPVGGASGRKL